MPTTITLQEDLAAAPTLPVEEEPTSLFDRWIGERQVRYLGTNSGAAPLAFQTWHHFKEAFPPELIKQMIDEDDVEVESCLDVFGGSGTTALASQLLGISSTTIEVNPFLADVIRAKTAHYDGSSMRRDLKTILARTAQRQGVDLSSLSNLPLTFVEPGNGERWIFDTAVANSLAGLIEAIAALEDEGHRRFFRVVLGGILTEVSNVLINGKGRRYRRNWKGRRRDPATVEMLFNQRAESAIADVERFAARPQVRVDILKGDAREVRSEVTHDLAILSPPYPNSFDYTDIYNLELWTLGYLSDSGDNRNLRESTLTSHVQLHREFADPPAGSPTLDKTLKEIEAIKEKLWNPWIPAMIGGYFADMMQVLEGIRESLRPQGRSCIVVGDSRYGGVLVPTAKILGELSKKNGWEVQSNEPVRAMRSSAQQGGSTNLDETLLILRKQAE